MNRLRMVTQAATVPMHRACRAPIRLLPFLAVAAGIALSALMDATMKGASIAAGVYSALLLRSALAA